jgi:hypothetical protein
MHYSPVLSYQQIVASYLPLNECAVAFSFPASFQLPYSYTAGLLGKVIWINQEDTSLPLDQRLCIWFGVNYIFRYTVHTKHIARVHSSSIQDLIHYWQMMQRVKGSEGIERNTQYPDKINSREDSVTGQTTSLGNGRGRFRNSLTIRDEEDPNNELIHCGTKSLVAGPSTQTNRDTKRARKSVTPPPRRMTAGKPTW